MKSLFVLWRYIGVLEAKDSDDYSGNGTADVIAIARTRAGIDAELNRMYRGDAKLEWAPDGKSASGPEPYGKFHAREIKVTADPGNKRVDAIYSLLVTAPGEKPEANVLGITTSTALVRSLLSEKYPDAELELGPHGGYYYQRDLLSVHVNRWVPGLGDAFKLDFGR